MEPHADITTRKRTWVVVLTGVASMMAALDTVVVSTALSTVRVHLHASVAQLEWTVNAYNLSFAVLLMTTAALGDRFGRKRMFAFGLGLTRLVAEILRPEDLFRRWVDDRHLHGRGADIDTDDDFVWRLLSHEILGIARMTRQSRDD